MKKALLAVLCLCPAVALAQPPRTNALTAEEVACNQTQLAGLLARLDVLGPLHEILVTYSNERAFEGIVVVPQEVLSGRLTPEYGLAFDLNPSLRELLSNPARLPLPQISLTREDSTSNLVRPTNPHALTLELNPLLSGTPAPADLLAVNNLEVPAPGAPYNGFRGTSAGPGRGLREAGLTAPCHFHLTDFDRRIFALLERMVRTSASLFLNGDTDLPLDGWVAVFRGADPHVYRVDFYPGSQYRAGLRMAVAIRVDWDGQGRLTTGRMEVLPFCDAPEQLECTSRFLTQYDLVTVRLIPPVLPGVQTWDPKDPRVRAVYRGFGLDAAPAVDVDFAALLAGTAWNTGGS